MSSTISQAKTNAEIRHDLKNSVASIKGYAQLLTSKLNSTDQANMAVFSQKIDKKCDDLIERINTLLADSQ